MRRPTAVAGGQRAARPRRGPLLCAKKLFKSYRKGKHVIPVLRGVDFAVRPGEFVAIVGQSGSGKSTLLHLLGTLDAPDAGEIHFEGNRIDNLPAAGARRAAQPVLRHDLSVLSPAAGTDDAGKRARAADDRRRRLPLLAEQAAASPNEPSSCWTWSAWRIA